MRKIFYIPTLIIIVLISLSFAVVGEIKAATEEIILLSPTACPPQGCAAGQRLNFQVSFSVTPNTTMNPNTQLCIYAPEDGSTTSGVNPWVSSSNQWISDVGTLSGTPFTTGETFSLCTDHLDSGDAIILSAYAAYPSTSNGQNEFEAYPSTTDDQIEFAFNINPEANTNGNVKVKIFQTKTDGTWEESTSLSTIINVDDISTSAYVAITADDCSDFSPCFVNSGDDSQNGLGTGLWDAVTALNSGSEIWILGNYTIKGNSVLVNNNLTIRGYQDAMITYSGMECNQPMLSFTNGGFLKDLEINDGSCENPSRDLILIDTTSDLAVEHNTLSNGHRAVVINNNVGNVSIAFNQIVNNQDYAVFHEGGNGGVLDVFANNIIDNNGGNQINCNSAGSANHNFWGDNILASSSALNCLASDGKRLGAPILLSNYGSGVEALRQPVTNQMTYAFDNRVGVQHTSGSDFNVIIVNHGQGSESNIPFYQAGEDPITPCSNYYDFFLEEDTVASELILSLKYDLNSNCINTIESSSLCSNTDSSKYPLWWFDPNTNVTDGWDRTGQSPAGLGAGGVNGQTTVCDIANKQISVTIDNTGRPNFSNDLNYTPFVAGFPLIEGIELSQFTVAFNANRNEIKWSTSSETNVKGFHVLRSETQSGPYTRITSLIDAIGAPYIGGVYQYLDYDISLATTYYYKIEIINSEDESIGLYGPVSVLSATMTPTKTQTRTPYPTFTLFPTRTPTPYIYRSPTSYYRPYTATPQRYPTQVRTYGPQPTSTLYQTRTQTVSPILETSQTPNGDWVYPVGGAETLTSPFFLAEEANSAYLTSTAFAVSNSGIGYPEDLTKPTTSTNITFPPEENYEENNIQWPFLGIGVISGVIILGFTSIILGKKYL